MMDHSSTRLRALAVLPALLGFVAVGAAVGGWFQHLYTCFTTGAWGFLIAGAIFAPVAIVHGWGIWLGIW